MEHEIDHMSDLHVDSSFYKQSMKIDDYVKIKEWINSSISQSTMLQQMDKKTQSLAQTCPNSTSVKKWSAHRPYITFHLQPYKHST